MYFHPYLAQRSAEERIKDRLHEAEQYRLIRSAEGRRKARGWWTSVMLMFSSLLSLVVRPQS
ncbi:MAG TPA: hypothetical protein EYH31_11915 [Anaerolineae bacterium]|nr:hypothetical protein [Anaerolineae bacterium]